ncbi:NAD(P)H-dependent flavin oxidoreductase YrpB, nitropropane dioxygenase family [Geoalkalibacter ferrihydriticus]|uniref:2-nitropropane dioxygenase n=2 Tax=Geoalkalibacter ferrihydriticus TaxID=392333 RepID=A0A0C2HMQ8_9BACT|nr:nitronate monooxygenase family protein [Geoalkalibacter ferrihydriticus]KIH76210.1 2-nitropropane dioxygenase [Geoalkalibacter ferrihydriticus DSM 17813]SDL27167.1 NAD(P)H-dependent flavin oxidoreductase YrpB, nitropropane dioxygenase family [Geoalkalibacter ferrihydriticus]
MTKSLTIGKHTVPYPLLQGGMGVRVSGGSLAGHVARCGGVGIVATAGIGINSSYYQENNYFPANAQALRDEIRKAYEIAPDGVVGTNCMVAVSDFDDLVRISCEAGAKVIVCGAGLPLNLPALTADYPDVALVPIVSSLKAAQLIARKWKKSFDRLPDAVVVEDPDTAGGHLGEKLENIGTGQYDQYATVRGVKAYFREAFDAEVPVIAAGGIWDRADVLHALEQGADGVQMASRFVCTEECDADLAYKQAYLNCRSEDIGLVMSPAGLPGRAIRANIDNVRQRDLDHGVICPSGCLKKCTYKEGQERFCIVHALDRAQRGDVDTGLVFCGTNAWKADRITTVQAIFNELFDLAVSVPAEGSEQAANG